MSTFLNIFLTFWNFIGFVSLCKCVCVYLDVCLCVCGVGALASVCVSVLWSWLIKLGTVRSGFVCVINDVSPALSHGKG